MIYEIVIAALILIIVLFIIYFFFPIKQKGIPKEPAKRPIVKEEEPLVPYYSEGEVIVEDELYGMKMIWDSSTAFLGLVVNLILFSLRFLSRSSSKPCS